MHPTCHSKRALIRVQCTGSALRFSLSQFRIACLLTFTAQEAKHQPQGGAIQQRSSTITFTYMVGKATNRAVTCMYFSQVPVLVDPCPTVLHCIRLSPGASPQQLFDLTDKNQWQTLKGSAQEGPPPMNGHAACSIGKQMFIYGGRQGRKTLPGLYKLCTGRCPGQEQQHHGKTITCLSTAMTTLCAFIHLSFVCTDPVN